MNEDLGAVLLCAKGSPTNLPALGRIEQRVIEMKSEILITAATAG